MSKRRTRVHWMATTWLALGMVSTGTVQVLRRPEEVDVVTRLGYPVYLLTMLGTWKLPGVIAVIKHQVENSKP